MAPPGAESKTLRDLFDENIDKEVDYVSDTEFVKSNGSLLATITGKTTTVVHLVHSSNVVLRTR